MAALMLSPSEIDGITEKGGGKEDMIHPCRA